MRLSLRFAVGTAIVATALLGAAAEETRTVYRAVGEHGVVEFSDQVLPNADIIELSVNEPSAETIEATARRLERELELLTYLEDSRRAREDDEYQERLNAIELARARAELERATAPAVEEESSYYPIHYPGAWWPERPGRPPFDRPEHPDRPDPHPRPEPVIHKPLPVKN